MTHISIPSQTSRRAFTLVEILIVVVILGILAAIVIPQFSSASDVSRENALKTTLYRIRNQIELYNQQHAGNYPTLADFEDQMVLVSNELGQTAAIGTDGYVFGPYLQEMPFNPFTSGKSVGDGAVGTSDWYYNESTGEFRANNAAEQRAY